MKDYRAALRYARALIGLVEDLKVLDQVEKELGKASALARKHPEISHLLANATVSLDEKEDFIEKILPQGFSNLTVNFLKVLVKKKRFKDLPLIQQSFHRLYEEKKGIQKVRVQSPITLNAQIQEKLRLALEKKLKRKVYFETSVNPEILGGFILDFDGTQLDGSYRTYLHELKQRLLYVKT